MGLHYMALHVGLEEIMSVLLFFSTQQSNEKNPALKELQLKQVSKYTFKSICNKIFYKCTTTIAFIQIAHLNCNRGYVS